MVKQNLQVVKLVDSEHVNENMVQNSSPTCKHNLFALIQSKKFLVFGFGHVGICKKAQEVQIPLCPTEMLLGKSDKPFGWFGPKPGGMWGPHITTAI